MPCEDQPRGLSGTKAVLVDRKARCYVELFIERMSLQALCEKFNKTYIFAIY